MNHVGIKTYRLYGDPTDEVSESFELSDLDMLMPATYVPFALIYKLPCHEARSEVVASLMRGLNGTLKQIPMLLGRLRVRSTNGRLWVSRSDKDFVALTVKDVKSASVSSRDLEEEYFSPALLDPHLLLPPWIMERSYFRPSSEEEEDIPVSTFQISFLGDYVVLSISLHHSCFDGVSYELITTRWSQNCRAFSAQTMPAVVDEGALNRSRLSAKLPPAAPHTTCTDCRLGCFTSLAAKVPAIKSVDSQSVTFAAVIYRFSKSSCERLRKRASKESMTPVSAYVAIVGWLWMAVTRSRRSSSRLRMTAETTLVNSVDVRSRTIPPLSTGYLGNAVALASTRLQIDTLLAPESFPQVARNVQQSIHCIDGAYVRDLTAWSASVEDKRDIRIDLNAHLGWDFAVTSFKNASYYQSADFGFSPPLAFRSLFTERDGCAFVYPSRPTDDLDEGIDVCVCLEKSCQNLLGLDGDLLRYASIRSR